MALLYKVTMFLVLTVAAVQGLELSDLVQYSSIQPFDVAGANTGTGILRFAITSCLVAGTEFDKIILGTSVGSSIKFVQDPASSIEYIINPYSVYNAAGEIYSDSKTDKASLDKVNKDIQNARNEFQNFVASWILVATWEDMIFKGASATSGRLINTYQAVIAVDDSTKHTFLILNYAKLEWSIRSQDATKYGFPDSPSTGVGPHSAKAEFSLSSDGGLKYSLPGSGSKEVVNLTTTSNVGVPGRWIFNITQSVQEIIDSKITTTAPESSESSDVIITVVAVVSGVLLLCCLVGAACVIKRKWKKSRGDKATETSVVRSQPTTSSVATTQSSEGKASSGGRASSKGKSSHEGKSSSSDSSKSGSEGSSSSEDSHTSRNQPPHFFFG